MERQSRVLGSASPLSFRGLPGSPGEHIVMPRAGARWDPSSRSVSLVGRLLPSNFRSSQVPEGDVVFVAAFESDHVKWQLVSPRRVKDFTLAR